MTVSLLQTKLYRPLPRPRGRVVPRPRLIDLLDRGRADGAQLSLISAPAGFGKTTLLAEWLSQCEPETAVAWLSLDPGDNDPQRFWTYLMTALGQVYPQVEDSILTQLGGASPPDVTQLLTELINLVAGDGRECLLVLDDHHAITSQEINQGLSFLVENLPPRLHLVISSRADPPWPLARWRARGEVTEVRADLLRFTEEEVTAFLNEVMELTLSPADIAELDRRTEGWIAGLQLAALSLQGRSDAATLVRSFGGTHRFVIDYLVEEVLGRQSEQINNFMLKTSILDRMTASLCDAVCTAFEGPCVSDSQELLDQLERANLFLVPLDDQRRWYRYHHLFADLLRRRLHETMPEAPPRLHSRASTWYEENGLLAQATSHAIESGDVGQIEKLVSRNILALMEYGELHHLRNQIDGLPDKLVRSQAWLSIAKAWVYTFTGRLEPVESLLLDAERVLADRDLCSGTERERGFIAAVRTQYHSVRGELEEAISQGQEVLNRLSKEDYLIRTWAMLAQANNYFRWGQIETAYKVLADAVPESQAAADSHIGVLVRCTLGAYQRAGGDLRLGFASIQDAHRLSAKYAARVGRVLPVGAYAELYMGAIYHQWNETEVGLEHINRALEITKRWGEPELLVGCYRHLAHLLTVSGDLEGALEAVHLGRQVARRLSPWYESRIDPTEARIRLELGDLAAASRWLDSQPDTLEGHFDIYDYWVAKAIRTRILFARGEPERALATVQRLWEDATEAGAVGYMVGGLVLHACLLDATGRREEALPLLVRALGLGQAGGYVRDFVNGGAAIVPLLKAVIERGHHVEYARRLLAAVQAEVDPEPAATGATTPARLIEGLTEREGEVLRLLPSSLSVPEIADQLYISVHTARSHIKSIYSKLCVHGRLEAVNRAEELGML